jgi:hypothetical protein
MDKRLDFLGDELDIKLEEEEFGEELDDIYGNYSSFVLVTLFAMLRIAQNTIVGNGRVNLIDLFSSVDQE